MFCSTVTLSPKMHCFCDIRLVAIQWPWKPGYWSLKVIETDTDRSATYDFRLMFDCNHGPISCRFRDKISISVEYRTSPTSVYFVSPLKGLPLELGTGCCGRGQKLEWWRYRAEKVFDDIFSRVDTIHQRDRQTDGQTPGDSKDRAYA